MERPVSDVTEVMVQAMHFASAKGKVLKFITDKLWTLRPAKAGLAKGHIEGDRFIPHAVEGAKWKASGFVLIKKPLSKSYSKRRGSNNAISEQR
ncbi:MAG: hypothetical protein ACREOO_01150 [bacterium]